MLKLAMWLINEFNLRIDENEDEYRYLSAEELKLIEQNEDLKKAYEFYVDVFVEKTVQV
jgi:hypothetical protein